MGNTWLTKQQVDQIKEMYPIGTTIRLIYMRDNIHPVESGMEGEIVGVDDQGQLSVKWENGRNLALVPSVDDFEVLEYPQQYQQNMC